MTTVMAFGTFDMLHEGHRYYLSEAKKLGDTLVVVVARDETVNKLKEKFPVHNEDYRLRQVKSLSFVNKAVLGNPGDKLEMVVDHKPYIIGLGYDQTFFTEQLREKLADRHLFPKIIRLPPHMPEMYKTSKIRERLAERF